MELTIEKAYELAVKKWEYIVENDGKIDYAELYDKIPELRDCLCDCSYCYLFRKDDNKCNGCPLDHKRPVDSSRTGCGVDGTEYAVWSNQRTKANAQAVLDLIIKTNPCTATK